MPAVPGRLTVAVGGLRRADGVRAGHEIVLQLTVRGTEGEARPMRTAVVEATGEASAILLPAPLEVSQNLLPPGARLGREAAWGEVAGVVDVVVLARSGAGGKERRLGDIALPIRALVDKPPVSGRQAGSLEAVWRALSHSAEADPPEVLLTAVLRLPPGVGGKPIAAGAHPHGKPRSLDDGDETAYAEDWEEGDSPRRSPRSLTAGGGAAGGGAGTSSGGSSPRSGGVRARRSSDVGGAAVGAPASAFAAMAAQLKATATASTPSAPPAAGDGKADDSSASGGGSGAELTAFSRRPTRGLGALLDATAVSTVTAATSASSPARTHSPGASSPHSPDRSGLRSSHGSGEYDDDDFEEASTSRSGVEAADKVAAAAAAPTPAPTPAAATPARSPAGDNPAAQAGAGAPATDGKAADATPTVVSSAPQVRSDAPAAVDLNVTSLAATHPSGSVTPSPSSARALSPAGGALAGGSDGKLDDTSTTEPPPTAASSDGKRSDTPVATVRADAPAPPRPPTPSTPVGPSEGKEPDGSPPAVPRARTPTEVGASAVQRDAVAADAIGVADEPPALVRPRPVTPLAAGDGKESDSPIRAGGRVVSAVGSVAPTPGGVTYISDAHMNDTRLSLLPDDDGELAVGPLSSSHRGGASPSPLGVTAASLSSASSATLFASLAEGPHGGSLAVLSPSQSVVMATSDLRAGLALPPEGGGSGRASWSAATATATSSTARSGFGAVSASARAALEASADGAAGRALAPSSLLPGGLPLGAVAADLFVRYGASALAAQRTSPADGWVAGSSSATGLLQLSEVEVLTRLTIGRTPAVAFTLLRLYAAFRAVAAGGSVDAFVAAAAGHTAALSAPASAVTLANAIAPLPADSSVLTVSTVSAAHVAAAACPYGLDVAYAQLLTALEGACAGGPCSAMQIIAAAAGWIEEQAAAVAEAGGSSPSDGGTASDAARMAGRVRRLLADRDPAATAFVSFAARLADTLADEDGPSHLWCTAAWRPWAGSPHFAAAAADMGFVPVSGEDEASASRARLRQVTLEDGAPAASALPDSALVHLRACAAAMLRLGREALDGDPLPSAALAGAEELFSGGPTSPGELASPSDMLCLLEAGRLLCKVVANPINSPADSRLWRLNAGNRLVTERLIVPLGRGTAASLLGACGFAHVGDAFLLRGSDLHRVATSDEWAAVVQRGSSLVAALDDPLHVPALPAALPPLPAGTVQSLCCRLLSLVVYVGQLEARLAAATIPFQSVLSDPAVIAAATAADPRWRSFAAAAASLAAPAPASHPGSATSGSRAALTAHVSTGPALGGVSAAAEVAGASPAPTPSRGPAGSGKGKKAASGPLVVPRSPGAILRSLDVPPTDLTIVTTPALLAGFMLARLSSAAAAADAAAAAGGGGGKSPRKGARGAATARGTSASGATGGKASGVVAAYVPVAAADPRLLDGAAAVLRGAQAAYLRLAVTGAASGITPADVSIVLAVSARALAQRSESAMATWVRARDLNGDGALAWPEFAACLGGLMVAVGAAPRALEIAAAPVGKPRAGASGGPGKAGTRTKEAGGPRDRTGLAVAGVVQLQQARAAFHKEAAVVMRTAVGVALHAQHLVTAIASGGSPNPAWEPAGAPPDDAAFDVAFADPAGASVVHAVAAVGLARATSPVNQVQRLCAYAVRCATAILARPGDRALWHLSIAHELSAAAAGHATVGTVVVQDAVDAWLSGGTEAASPSRAPHHAGRKERGAQAAGGGGGGAAPPLPADLARLPGALVLLGAMGWVARPDGAALVLGGEGNAAWTTVPAALQGAMAACRAALAFRLEALALEEVPDPAAALLGQGLLATGGALMAVLRAVHMRSEAAAAAAGQARDAYLAKQRDAAAAAAAASAAAAAGAAASLGGGGSGAASPVPRLRAKSEPAAGGRRGKKGADAGDGGAAAALAAALAVFRDDSSLDAMATTTLAGPAVARWLPAVEGVATLAAALSKVPPTALPGDAALRLDTSAPDAPVSFRHSLPLPLPGLPVASSEAWAPARASSHVHPGSLVTLLGYREVDGRPGVLGATLMPRPHLAARECEMRAVLPLLRACSALASAAGAAAVFAAGAGGLTGDSKADDTAGAGHAALAASSLSATHTAGPPPSPSLRASASDAASLRAAPMLLTVDALYASGDAGDEEAWRVGASALPSELPGASTFRFLPGASGGSSAPRQYDLADGGEGDGGDTNGSRATSAPPATRRARSWLPVEDAGHQRAGVPTSGNAAEAVARLASEAAAAQAASRAQIESLQAALQATQAQLKAVQLSALGSRTRADVGEVLHLLQQGGAVSADDVARLRAVALGGPVAAAAPPAAPKPGAGERGTRGRSAAPGAVGGGAAAGRSPSPGRPLAAGSSTARSSRGRSGASAAASPRAAMDARTWVVTSIAGDSRNAIRVDKVGGEGDGVSMLAPGFGLRIAGALYVVTSVQPTSMPPPPVTGVSVVLDEPLPDAVTAPVSAESVLVEAPEAAARTAAQLAAWIRSSMLPALVDAVATTCEQRAALQAADFAFGQRTVSVEEVASAVLCSVEAAVDSASASASESDAPALAVGTATGFALLPRHGGGGGVVVDLAADPDWAAAAFHAADRGAEGLLSVRALLRAASCNPSLSAALASTTTLPFHAPYLTGTGRPQPMIRAVWRRLAAERGDAQLSAHAFAALFRRLHPFDHVCLGEAEMEVVARVHVHPASDILTHTHPEQWGAQWDAVHAVCPLDDGLMILAAGAFAAAHVADFAARALSADDAVVASAGLSLQQAVACSWVMDGVPLTADDLRRSLGGDVLPPSVSFADLMTARAARDARHAAGEGAAPASALHAARVSLFPLPGVPRRLLALRLLQTAFASIAAGQGGRGGSDGAGVLTVSWADLASELRASVEGRKVLALPCAGAGTMLSLGDTLAHAAATRGALRWADVRDIAAGALRGVVSVAVPGPAPVPLPVQWSAPLAPLLDAASSPSGHRVYTLTLDGFLSCTSGHPPFQQLWRAQVLPPDACHAVAAVRASSAHPHLAPLVQVMQLRCGAGDDGPAGDMVSVNRGAAALALMWQPPVVARTLGFSAATLQGMSLWADEDAAPGPRQVACVVPHLRCPASPGDASTVVLASEVVWCTEAGLAILVAPELGDHAGSSAVLAMDAVTGLVVCAFGSWAAAPGASLLPVWCAASQSLVVCAAAHPSDQPVLRVWDAAEAVEAAAAVRAALGGWSTAQPRSQLERDGGATDSLAPTTSFGDCVPLPVHLDPAYEVSVSNALQAGRQAGGGAGSGDAGPTVAAPVVAAAAFDDGRVVVALLADGHVVVWSAQFSLHRLRLPLRGRSVGTDAERFLPADWTALPAGVRLLRSSPPRTLLAVGQAHATPAPPVGHRHCIQLTGVLAPIPTPAPQVIVELDMVERARAGVAAWMSGGAGGAGARKPWTCGYLYAFADGAVHAVSVPSTAAAFDPRWMQLADSDWLQVDGAAMLSDDALLALRAVQRRMRQPTARLIRVYFVLVRAADVGGIAAALATAPAAHATSLDAPTPPALDTLARAATAGLAAAASAAGSSGGASQAAVEALCTWVTTPGRTAPPDGLLLLFPFYASLADGPAARHLPLAAAHADAGPAPPPLRGVEGVLVRLHGDGTATVALAHEPRAVTVPRSCVQSRIGLAPDVGGTAPRPGEDVWVWGEGIRAPPQASPSGGAVAVMVAASLPSGMRCTLVLLHCRTRRLPVTASGAAPPPVSPPSHAAMAGFAEGVRRLEQAVATSRQLRVRLTTAGALERSSAMARVAHGDGGGNADDELLAPPASAPVAVDGITVRTLRRGVWLAWQRQALSWCAQIGKTDEAHPAALGALVAAWHSPWMRWCLSGCLSPPAPGALTATDGWSAATRVLAPGLLDAHVDGAAAHVSMVLLHGAPPLSVLAAHDASPASRRAGRGPLLEVWTDASVGSGVDVRARREQRFVWDRSATSAGWSQLVDVLGAERHGGHGSDGGEAAENTHPAHAAGDALLAVVSTVREGVEATAPSDQAGHLVQHAVLALLAASTFEAMQLVAPTSAPAAVPLPEVATALIAELRACLAAVPSAVQCNGINAAWVVTFGGLCAAAGRACAAVSQPSALCVLQGATAVASAAVHAGALFHTFPPADASAVIGALAAAFRTLHMTAVAPEAADALILDCMRHAFTGRAVVPLHHQQPGAADVGAAGSWPALRYAGLVWPAMDALFTEMLGVAAAEAHSSTHGASLHTSSARAQPAPGRGEASTAGALSALLQCRLVKPLHGYLPPVGPVADPGNRGAASGVPGGAIGGAGEVPGGDDEPAGPSFAEAAAVVATPSGYAAPSASTEALALRGGWYWGQFAGVARAIAALSHGLPDAVLDVPTDGGAAGGGKAGGRTRSKPAAASMAVHVRLAEQLMVRKQSVARFLSLLQDALEGAARSDAPQAGPPAGSGNLIASALCLLHDVGAVDVMASLLDDPDHDVRAAAFTFGATVLERCRDLETTLAVGGGGQHRAAAAALPAALQARYAALDVVLACARRLAAYLHAWATGGGSGGVAGEARGAPGARASRSRSGGSSEPPQPAGGAGSESTGTVVAAVNLLAAQLHSSAFHAPTWRSCGIFGLLVRCTRVGGGVGAVADRCNDLLRHACADMHDDNVLAQLRIDATVHQWMRARGITIAPSTRAHITHVVEAIVQAASRAARAWQSVSAGGEGAEAAATELLTPRAVPSSALASPRATPVDVARGYGEVGNQLRIATTLLPGAANLLLSPRLRREDGGATWEPFVLALWTLAGVAWSAIAATSPSHSVRPPALAYSGKWLDLCAQVQACCSPGEVMALLSADAHHAGGAGALETADVPTGGWHDHERVGDPWPGIAWLVDCIGTDLPALPFDADGGRGVQGQAMQWCAAAVDAWGRLWSAAVPAAAAGDVRGLVAAAAHQLVHGGIAGALARALRSHAVLMRTAVHHNTTHLHLLASGGRDVAAGLVGRGALLTSLLRLAVGAWEWSAAAQPGSDTHAGEDLAAAAAEALCNSGVFTTLLLDMLADTCFVDSAHVTLPPSSAMFAARHPVRLEAVALLWMAAVLAFGADAHHAAQGAAAAAAGVDDGAPAGEATLTGARATTLLSPLAATSAARGLSTVADANPPGGDRLLPRCVSLLQDHIAGVVVGDGVLGAERHRLWAMRDGALQATVCTTLQAVLLLCPRSRPVRSALEALGVPVQAVQWMRAARGVVLAKAIPRGASTAHIAQAVSRLASAEASAVAAWSSWRAERFGLAPTATESELAGPSARAAVTAFAATAVPRASRSAGTAAALHTAAQLGGSLRRSMDALELRDSGLATPAAATKSAHAFPVAHAAQVAARDTMEAAPGATPATPTVQPSAGGGRLAAVEDTAAVLARLGDMVVDVQEVFDAERERTTIGRGSARADSVHGDVSAAFPVLAALTSRLGFTLDASVHAACVRDGVLPSARCTFSQFVRLLGRLMDDAGLSRLAETPSHTHHAPRAAMAASPVAATHAPSSSTRPRASAGSGAVGWAGAGKEEPRASPSPPRASRLQPASPGWAHIAGKDDTLPVPLELLRSVFERFAVTSTTAGMVTRTVPFLSASAALAAAGAPLATVGDVEPLFRHVHASPAMGLTYEQLVAAWRTAASLLLLQHHGGGDAVATDGDGDSVISDVSI